MVSTPASTAARSRPARASATNAAVDGHAQPLSIRCAVRNAIVLVTPRTSTVSGHRPTSSMNRANENARVPVMTVSTLPPVTATPAGTPTSVSSAAAQGSERGMVVTFRTNDVFPVLVMPEN
jgi:hypothetical protein